MAKIVIQKSQLELKQKTYNIVYKMNESDIEVIDTGLKVTIKVSGT